MLDVMIFTHYNLHILHKVLTSSSKYRYNSLQKKSNTDIKEPLIWNSHFYNDLLLHFFDYRAANDNDVLRVGLSYLVQNVTEGKDRLSRLTPQTACWLLTNQHYCSYTPLHSPKWLIFVGSHT